MFLERTFASIRKYIGNILINGHHAVSMTASSNTSPPLAWTSRILFRIGGTGEFHWFEYPGEHDPRAAQAAAQKLLCDGLNVLVCTTDEFNEIGLPHTYTADEYFSPA